MKRGLAALLLAGALSHAAGSRAQDPDAIGFGEDAHEAADAVGFGDEPSDSRDPDAIGFGDEEGGQSPDAVGFGEAQGEAEGDAATTHRSPEPSEADDPLAGTLDASGGVAHRSALWIERLQGRPFAQARTSLDLALRYKKPLGAAFDAPRLRLVAEGHLEYDAAYLQPHLRRDEPSREAYAAQLIGRETYVALSLGAVELVVGRQIVPFGQGEILSPIDVVNPRDQREPGLAEIEDLRMAVLASRIGYYVDAHRFELLVVHESYFGLRPAPLSDYSPLRALLNDDPRVAAVLASKELRYDDVPDRFTTGAGQLYARWSYAGEGLDLALYAASTLDKQGVPTLPSAAELLGDELSLRLWHPRYTMLATSGAAPLDAFILRWEASVDLGRPLSVRDERGEALALDFVRRDLANLLLAFAYFGVSDTTIALEYAQSVLLAGASLPAGTSLLGPVQAPAFGLRVTRTLLRETLTLQLVAMLLGLDPYVGSFARFEFDYELATALHWNAGYALYLPSPDEVGPFYGLTTHDRVYSGLRWDFAL